MRIKDMVVGSEGKQCRDQPERQPCGFSLVDKVCDDVGPVLAVVRSSIEGERRHHDTVWTLWASGHSITHASYVWRVPPYLPPHTVKIQSTSRTLCKSSL